MLKRLSVENYALIDQLDIAFAGTEHHHGGDRRWEVDFAGGSGTDSGEPGRRVRVEA